MNENKFYDEGNDDSEKTAAHVHCTTLWNAAFTTGKSNKKQIECEFDKKINRKIEMEKMCVCT